jgi:hypothetical protein
VLRAAILPLPEKKVIGKFKPEFIERRRLGLQGFLTAVRVGGALTQKSHTPFPC